MANGQNVRLDYGTLLTYERANAALAEDTPVYSTARVFGSDEGFQVSRVEIFPPFDAMGNLEELTVQLIIDGDSVDLVHLHSDAYPPALENVAWMSIPLGNHLSNNPFENTCLKGNKKLQIKCIAGQGGLSGAGSSDFIVKLKGDYFKGDDAVRRRFGSTFNPVPATWYDAQRKKSVTVYRPVAATIDNLNNMSGGAPKADFPRVLPYVAFAYNANATTVNTDYPYVLAHSGNVANDWADMRWELGSDEAVILEYLAAREVPHSRYLWIQVGDQKYPKGDSTTGPYFDIRYHTNELPFSTMFSMRGITKYPLLIHDELAELRVMDDGTSIAANTLRVGVWGKKVEGLT